LGLLQPVLAATVMAGSSILVVVNSLRLERLPDPIPLPVPRRLARVEAESVCADIPVMAGPVIEPR